MSPYLLQFDSVFGRLLRRGRINRFRTWSAAEHSLGVERSTLELAEKMPSAVPLRVLRKLARAYQIESKELELALLFTAQLRLNGTT